MKSVFGGIKTKNFSNKLTPLQENTSITLFLGPVGCKICPQQMMRKEARLNKF